MAMPGKAGSFGMQILQDQRGKKTAYLYNNVILLPGHVVAGVLLAHCVFARTGQVKGKFFKEHLYNERGEIIALTARGESEQITPETARRIMVDAWKILALTKEHTCPWVNATDKWCELTLEEFLS
jgi:hypothetical protein